MERQSSCGSTDSGGSSTHRGRLVFTVLSALAQANALSVPMPEHWQGYGALMPPPRADVDAALAASALALRMSASDAVCCSECGSARGRQLAGGGRVSSVSDGDLSDCPRCKERAGATGCFPVLRRRRVSPNPPPPSG